MTAVEWYYDQTVVLGKTNYYELLEQAKQMERKQIEEAYINGDRNGFCRYKNIGPEQITSSDYFTQTYQQPTE